jgi:hypothetical protein
VEAFFMSNQSLSPEVTHLRATIAALSRSRTPDDPDLVGARRDLATLRVARKIDALVADWPALTDAQLDRIAALLRSGGGR